MKSCLVVRGETWKPGKKLLRESTDSIHHNYAAIWVSYSFYRKNKQGLVCKIIPARLQCKKTFSLTNSSFLMQRIAVLPYFKQKMKSFMKNKAKFTRKRFRGESLKVQPSYRAVDSILIWNTENRSSCSFTRCQATIESIVYELIVFSLIFVILETYMWRAFFFPCFI